MADDKNDRGAQDRARDSASEPYEVTYFASKYGIPYERAKAIIEKHGPSREACDRAVSN